jgi:Ca2+-binding EF-hand superfamily protein
MIRSPLGRGGRWEERVSIMRWTTIAVLTSGFLATGAVTAASDPISDPTAEDARKAHAEVDVNGDGSVDREEFYDRMVEMFYHNDGDKNGYLDRTELRKIQEEMVFDPADENGDGKLTMGEYIDQRFEAFRSADVNSDGLLSVEEVVAAYESR